MIKKQHGKLRIIQSEHDSEIPKQCPICSDKNTPDCIKNSVLEVNESHYYSFYLFRCKNCDKEFLTINEFLPNPSGSGLLGKIIQTVPYYLELKIPVFMDLISPKAVKFYKAAVFAESEGYVELAGTGYRSCMEILIKDFLIKELKNTDPKIPKMKLINVISELKHLPLKKSADVVRIIGNELTHYVSELSDNDFEIMKYYLKTTISFLEMTYMGLHPLYERENPFTF